MPPALVAAFAFAILPMSWGRWSDVLVDFGQQLYVPWRLAHGDVLYRDVAYLHGPLSQYVNALLFRVFGEGYWTLVWFNLATTALLVALIWRLFGRLGGALSATVASLLFLAVFAFGQPLAIGNYNYVTPYVHEITHGILLALAGVWALARLDESRRAGWAAAAGLLLGLAFLTKAETFVAAAAADAAFLVAMRRRLPRGALAAFAGALLTPPLAAFLLFATALPPGAALLAALGPVRPGVLLGGAASNVFFLEKIGLTHPESSLAAASLAIAAYAFLLGPAWLAARRLPPERERGAALAAAGLVAALLVVGFPRVPWLAFSLPFPLLTAILAVDAARRGERLRLALAVLALALLPKILLSTVVVHYGFVLAMPATLLAADTAVSRVPSRLAARGGAPWVLRAPALVILAFVAGGVLLLSASHLAAKVVRVGTGRDAFLADARGAYVNGALDELGRLRRPGETLAAVPEGAILNYLLRMPSPTPYTNLMPTELTVFGEDAILAAFRARPPQLLAAVHKSTAEYGLPFFGRDYGKRLGTFFDERYAPVSLVGAQPFRGEGFGIAILKRK